MLARPWAPFVFDDQDDPRHQRPLPIKARQGDPDLAQAQPGWITFAYDEPPGPRRVVGRAKRDDQDPSLPYPLWVRWAYDEPPGPRRAILRARTTDPDLIGRLGPIWRPFTEEVTQFPKRILVHRSIDLDPIVIPAAAVVGVVIEDVLQEARRLLWRGRTNDLDVPIVLRIFVGNQQVSVTIVG